MARQRSFDPAQVRRGLALGAVALVTVHLGYAGAVAVVDLASPNLPAAESGRIAARLTAPAVLLAAMALLWRGRPRAALLPIGAWAFLELLGGPALGTTTPTRWIPLLMILPLFALGLADPGRPPAARRVAWPLWLAAATFVALATITAGWTPAGEADGTVGSLPAFAPVCLALAAVAAALARREQVLAIAAFPVLASSAVRALTWDTVAGSRADDGAVLLAVAVTAILAASTAIAVPPPRPPVVRRGLLGRGSPITASRPPVPLPTRPARSNRTRPQDQELVNRRRQTRRYPIPLRTGTGPLIVFPEEDEEG